MYFIYILGLGDDFIFCRLDGLTKMNFKTLKAVDEHFFLKNAGFKHFDDDDDAPLCNYITYFMNSKTFSVVDFNQLSYATHLR